MEHNQSSKDLLDLCENERIHSVNQLRGLQSSDENLFYYLKKM